MKKYYKLLIVILLSFFVGVYNVYASPEAEDENVYGFHSYNYDHPSIISRKLAPIGEYVYMNFDSLTYSDYYIGNTSKCNIKAYFNSMEDKFVEVDSVNGNQFLITNDFVPNTLYELYKLDIECNGIKGSVIVYNQQVKDFSIYVLEESPTKGAVIDIVDRAHKDQKIEVSIKKDYGEKSEAININYDSMLLYYGTKDEYFTVPVNHTGDKTYEIDLKKINGKYEENKSYSLLKMEMVVNGKKYTYDHSGFDKNRSYQNYPLNSWDSLTIYTELLTNVSIDKTNAKYNESVYLNLKKTREPVSGTIQLKNTRTGEIFSSTIRDINSKPYFVVPCTVEEGEYELYYISLKAKGDYNGKIYDYDDYSVFTVYEYFFNKEYFKEKPLISYIDYKYKINIEKDDGTIRAELLELDNKKITDEILTNIKKLDGNVKINVDASNDTKIKKELFDAIKGSDKTLTIIYNNHEWVIKGKDVKNAKDIDVKIDIKEVSTNEDIEKKTENAVILEFADNGELPGKSKIRINNDSKISDVIKNKEVNLYLYDGKTKRFTSISSDIKLDDEGFYELELDHNSTYVITNTKIKDKYLAGNNDILIMILLIIAAIVTVLLIGFVVFLLIKNKKKKKQQEPVVETTSIVEATPEVETTPVENAEVETPIEEEKKEE